MDNPPADFFGLGEQEIALQLDDLDFPSQHIELAGVVDTPHALRTHVRAQIAAPDRRFRGCALLQQVQAEHAREVLAHLDAAHAVADLVHERRIEPKPQLSG